jgi:hypothetical protein
MNFFARFVRNLRAMKLTAATNQEIGSDYATLTLIPNSPLPNKSLTHRKVYPTKKLTDPEFVYTDSTKTNIFKTFQKFKQE